MAKAAAAATAASALLRHSSGLSPWLSSTFTPKSHIFFFSTLPDPESFCIGAHAIRPVTSPSEGDIGSDDAVLKTSRESFKKSRNELKREAHRAVRWGMDISSFSLQQIKSILSAASLEREVLDAILLVKRLGPDVREGRRRQFNYIGKTKVAIKNFRVMKGIHLITSISREKCTCRNFLSSREDDDQGRLLRKAQPELMDALIQASRDGDISRLQNLTGQTISSIDDSEDVEEELEYELEEGENYMEVADKWLDGLIYKDPAITNEVYSIHSVDFDRQELRRLVRRAQSIQEESNVDQSVLEGDEQFNKSKRPLLLFLRSLAKKSLAE